VARIHVKLVAQVGVGTVAAGVVKAHADVVLISGHDGGTGAAPLTSLKHAGIPWELGLAETQQTLRGNGLRDRVVVQVDGQLKTGRDVVIAMLLGAEEFGFATAPLVVAGCVMMRVCHLDTCPVGVATQNPELRARFTGTPEFVETFFEFLAHEVREILASMGLRSIDEAIGRIDLLDVKEATSHWKARSLDLAPLLAAVEPAHGTWQRHRKDQDHGVDRALERTILDEAIELAAAGQRSTFSLRVTNADRAIGTQLGAAITRRFGSRGLDDDSVILECTGSAGQSFGAFIPKGLTLHLTGDANDYLGKGLSGGIIVVAAPPESVFDTSTQVIAGNVIGYGATAGELFLAGQVGERFCVRNSGAIAVVEGVGDHACEYMTGGHVVVLGQVGRNFAAGMSGGIAYVFDPSGTFDARVNQEMVDVEVLDDADETWLVERIARFSSLTGSHTAASLLADWHSSVADFKKVVPREYRRVLEAIAAAEREGRPADAAVMELAHG
jgi:glutamate synthase (NADPH/NADH) large chain